MIILEGVDNSGKTTLATTLSSELGMKVRHSVRPPNDRIQAYWAGMDQINSQLIIADRINIISELVYGVELRGGSALGKLHDQALYDLLNKDFLIVYCRPPLSKILNNQGRDQMEGVLDNHKKLVYRYDEVMMTLKNAGANIIDYDWTDKECHENLLSNCRDFVLRHKEKILNLMPLFGE